MTPSLDCGILSGITREVVIQLAKESGFLVEEGEWYPDELGKADEIFITGTVRRVMPVTVLDGKLVGNGKPGPVTMKLIRLYDGLLQGLFADKALISK